MADRADFFVKNVLPGNIRVLRKMADGVVDTDLVLSPGAEEKVVIPDTQVSLIIMALARTDIKYCHFRVISDVDLNVVCSRTDMSWTVKIVPNDLPADIPTTVNVEVGENPPR